MGTRVVIDQPSVTKFTQTDPALQRTMNLMAKNVQEQIKDYTPIGKGLDEPKFGSPVATTPGHARESVEMVKYRWWRRIRSRDIAGHIDEFGSPAGVDSIGRRHYPTKASRPFTRAALISGGRFDPKGKPESGDE